MDQQQPDRPKIDRLTIILLCSVIIFLILRVGFGYGLNWFDNDFCPKYLGCTGGFFGFDMLVHFSTGVLEVISIFWLVKRFPKLNILHDKFWKNVIILVAFAALIGVVWEFWEFGVDHFRMFILHWDLFYPKNLLMQASNTDTTGDLVLGLLGALSAIFSLKSMMPEVFKSDKNPA
jgi:hypothetical protein